MQDCKDAGMKPLDLNWVDTDKSVDPTRKKIRSRFLCKRIQNEEVKLDSTSSTRFSIVLCNAIS